MSDVQPRYRKHAPASYLGSDNAPLFRFHRWRANLRILRVCEVKIVPCVPLKFPKKIHPPIESVASTQSSPIVLTPIRIAQLDIDYIYKLSTASVLSTSSVLRQLGRPLGGLALARPAHGRETNRYSGHQSMKRLTHRFSDTPEDNGHALSHGHYRTIVKLCEELRDLVRQLGDARLIAIVDVACQAITASYESSDVAQYLWEACAKAREREQKLLEVGGTLVRVLSGDFRRKQYAERPRLLCFNEALGLPRADALLAQYRDVISRLADLLDLQEVKEAANELHGLTEPQPADESSFAAASGQRSMQDICSAAGIDEGSITASEAGESEAHASASLAVYLLSSFQVLIDHQPVVAWPNCRGKSIFKYLISHREHPIPKEVLMEVFWPDADPDAARNNLNVAIYGLRKVLAQVNKDISYVQFEGGRYALNPTLRVWVDSEEFMAHVSKGQEFERRGDEHGAICEYRAAEAIYQEGLLLEDLYEDWLYDLRQSFQDAYVKILYKLSEYHFARKDYESSVTTCSKIIIVDACDESAHGLLMRSYSRLGQPHLAVRQYHLCSTALAREVQLEPAEETRQLFNRIRQGQMI